MRWRSIGPTRAGRARALSGVPSQPNVFYIGFDNGGVWRSTDFGSDWMPLFDSESTGSIGAIAVAPSDPNIIYVGTGAGIIRPDLATGDGMYKSTDAGKTWTHLGLRDTPDDRERSTSIRANPNRLFVAALGHPYGPNAERGIFRSTDGGATFQKVLYKDEYVSGNDVRIDPSDPNIVYAALWQQQQSYIEGGGFGGNAQSNDGGIFKSTDGGTTWKQLTDGLPGVLQANLAIAPSNPKVHLRDGRVHRAVRAAGGRRRGGGAGAGGGGRRRRRWRRHDRILQDHRRRRALVPRDRRSARRREAVVAHSRGPASARAHRRRRPADRHRRSEERERRLQLLDRVLAHRGRRRDVVGRARRARRRRLSEGLDQSRQSRTSSSPSPIRAASSRPIAASRGATGTRSRRPRCITSPRTTPFRIASAAASRTRARRASTAAATTARSRSTTGIR